MSGNEVIMEYDRVDKKEYDDDNNEDEDEDEGLLANGKQQVYIPGVSRPLKEGEELDYDPEAYRLFHTFQTELPCLSFDVICDTLGNNRNEFPLKSFIVGGTQAEKAKDNHLIVMRLSNMYGIEKDKDDDDDDDDDSSDEESEADKARQPKLHTAVIPQFGDTNRLKCETISSTPVCAVWNDQVRVQIWNLSNGLTEIDKMEDATTTTKLTSEKPLFTFSGHSAPGYALGWSPLKTGTLASGDNNKKIFIWNIAEAGQWAVDQRPLVGHESSVEDLQWSFTEEPLLISCSADGSIRLWDIRIRGQQSCVHTVKNAHDSDVNVISWNRFDPLIVSGGDDGILKIWSLKTIQYNQSIATFTHHKGPITSVEWSSYENTTLMASGEDNQITIWDLAMEADEQAVIDDVTAASGDASNVEINIPPQLLFVHMGSNEIKELHWHPQITGLALSTALDGFHAFCTINV